MDFGSVEDRSEAGTARRTGSGSGEPPRPADATQGVSPMATDPEQFDEHLRPAWHVVVATTVVLAAAVLASWLGH